MKATPGNLLLFDDRREGAIGFSLFLFCGALAIIAVVSQLVSKSSVHHALIRAKKLGTAVKVGGKIRSV